MLSDLKDLSRMKLGIKYRRKFEELTNIDMEINTLINNQWVEENHKRNYTLE